MSCDGRAIDQNGPIQKVVLITLQLCERTSTMLTLELT